MPGERRKKVKSYKDSNPNIQIACPFAWTSPRQIACPYEWILNDFARLSVPMVIFRWYYGDYPHGDDCSSGAGGTRRKIANPNCLSLCSLLLAPGTTVQGAALPGMVGSKDKRVPGRSRQERRRFDVHPRVMPCPVVWR